MVPASAGVPPRARRHGPGLSREEVAYLAGISADWYGRLEGGLDAAPSAATLLSLAQVLKLTPVETEYLFALASIYPPRFQDETKGNVPEALRRLILGTEDVGVMFWDPYMTPLAWNRTADSMFNISPFATPIERNIIVRMADQHFIHYFGEDYDVVMRRLVGVFRRAYAARPTPFARDILSIAESYPQFKQYWDGYEVADETTLGPGPHTRHHPIAGTYSMVVVEMFPLRRHDMLRVLAPADEASAKQFAVLRSLGKPFE